MKFDRFPAYLGLVAALAWFAALAVDPGLPTSTAVAASLIMGAAWSLTSLIAENLLLPLIAGAPVRLPVLRLPRISVRRVPRPAVA